MGGDFPGEGGGGDPGFDDKRPRFRWAVISQAKMEAETPVSMRLNRRCHRCMTDVVRASDWQSAYNEKEGQPASQQRLSQVFLSQVLVKS